MATVTDTPATAVFDRARFDAVLDSLARGAAERERDRVAPVAEIRALARTGFGAMRIPAAQGGHGSSLRELFAAVVALARADSNVAQSLRAHFHFVEGRIGAADSESSRRWLAEVTRGALFGNGTVERSTSDIFGFETTLVRDGDGYRLNGTKYYSTGTLYCDWISVAARGPDGDNVSAIVPVDREGVAVVDDWDGIGQRLSASGTTRLTDVFVAADEVLPSPIGRPAASPRSTFLQLYLVAVMAGIAGAAARDAAAIPGSRKRTFSHAPAETPSDDPLIQRVVGEIASSAFAAEAVVLAAAEALDEAQRTSDPDDGHRAAVLAAQAQVVVSGLAPRAAQMLFDTGGASAVSRAANLDRHWRNARTIASHNPAMYKAQAVGDLLINGTQLPGNGFF